jgi:hypothetical protein
MVSLNSVKLSGFLFPNIASVPREPLAEIYRRVC